MKPEILVPSMGMLNERLGMESIRVDHSVVWKKQRVVVVIPAAEDIPTKVALSMWNLIFPPNQQVARIGAIGVEVGAAYSTTIEWILAHEELRSWEYVLTMEHDNVAAPDAVMRLLNAMDEHPEFAAISGLYWTKGVGGVPQIWGDPKDPVMNFRPQRPKEGEIVECCGIGMGFALWRMETFKDGRIAKPLFRTKASMEEGVGTQDLSFWAEARKWGHRCAVDCRVLVGHYDKATDTTW